MASIEYCVVCGQKLGGGFSNMIAKPYELKEGRFCKTCGEQIVADRRAKNLKKYS